MTPFVDLSLARTVLEVFLRPIEGTMLVKSKRYLKLEAGKGKAQIKSDRYAKNIIVPGFFSKLDPSLENYNSDNLGTIQQMLEYVLPLLSQASGIGSLIDDFSEKYVQKWQDAYDKKRAYLATANTCILKEKVNDLEEETFDKVTWVNRDENSFNGKYIDGIQDSVKTEHATKANAFGLAVASFFVHKNRFEHLADHDDAADDPKVKKDVWAAFGSSLIRLDNELDDDWDELYSAQIRPPKPSSNYLDVRDPSDLYVNKTFLKRKWALLFLLKLSEKDSKYASALKLSYVDTDLTEDRLCDNFKWSKMISNIQFLSTHPFLGSLINSLKDPFLKKLDMTAWMHTFRDRDMWADKEGGQILFSDSSEKTSALENLQQGDASSYIEANQYTIAALKKALSSIN